MSVRATMSKKVYKMKTSIKSHVLTDSFQCWPEMTFFKNIFHDANDAFSCGLYVEINTKISKMAV